MTLHGSLQHKSLLDEPKGYSATKKGQELFTIGKLVTVFVHLMEVWYAGFTDGLQLNELIDCDKRLEDGDADHSVLDRRRLLGPHFTIKVEGRHR